MAHDATPDGRPPTPLDTEFSATLQKSPAKGGWTYVVMPGSVELFGSKVMPALRAA